jgi:hypothetical protein
MGADHWAGSNPLELDRLGNHGLFGNSGVRELLADVSAHPSIRSAPLSWTQLRDVHRKVAAGDFANVASKHRFPSQLFSYGFEHAAALEHAVGRRVDLQPMRRLDTTLFGLIDLNTFQDPNIKDL